MNITKQEYDYLKKIEEKVIEFLDDLENDFPNEHSSNYNQPASSFITGTKKYGKELKQIFTKTRT